MSWLDRARRELGAARALADGGFYSQAISSAYYAAFYAATETLAESDDPPPKSHSGLIRRFGSEIVARGAFDPAIAKHLTVLFQRRNLADYSPDEDAGEDEARRSIEDAARFIKEAGRAVGND